MTSTIKNSVHSFPWNFVYYDDFQSDTMILNLLKQLLRCIRGGFTIEFSEMRGPNKIFGSFISQNEPNILFGPLISENSIITPPLVS